MEEGASSDYVAQYIPPHGARIYVVWEDKSFPAMLLHNNGVLTGTFGVQFMDQESKDDADEWGNGVQHTNNSRWGCAEEPHSTAADGPEEVLRSQGFDALSKHGMGGGSEKVDDDLIPTGLGFRSEAAYRLRASGRRDRLCAVEGCPSVSRGKSGCCPKHSQQCTREGCSSLATVQRLCLAHAEKADICLFKGCITAASVRGFCWDHRNSASTTYAKKKTLQKTKVRRGPLSSSHTLDGANVLGRRRRGTINVGDKIKAYFQGDTAAKYPGVVAVMHSDGTYDIHFDDGDKEKFVGLCVRHGKQYGSTTSNGPPHQARKQAATTAVLTKPTGLAKGEIRGTNGSVYRRLPGGRRALVCNMAGCSVFAQKRGLCIKHGGTDRCKVAPNCKARIVHGACSKHGYHGEREGSSGNGSGCGSAGVAPSASASASTRGGRGGSGGNSGGSSGGVSHTARRLGKIRKAAASGAIHAGEEKPPCPDCPYGNKR
eukprot:gene6040-15615_t